MKQKNGISRNRHNLYSAGFILALICLCGFMAGCAPAAKEKQEQAGSSGQVPLFSAVKIDTPEKFAQAYQNGIPVLSQEETAELQKLADQGMAADLLVPDTSAVQMLNISSGQIRNLYRNPDGTALFLYAWNDQDSVFIHLAQPAQKGQGGIWTVTGYSSLTEDGLYWYDDLVNFSDGLVEIMGTKISYQTPTEAEANKLLEHISPRQQEMMMSRAVKCYIAAQRQKYDVLKPLCSKELAAEIAANMAGGSPNEYGGRTLLWLKNNTADKPAKIYLPQADTGASLYAVTLDLEQSQRLFVHFQIEPDGDVSIAKVEVPEKQ